MKTTKLKLRWPSAVTSGIDITTTTTTKNDSDAYICIYLEIWEKQRGILWISSLSISFMEVNVSYLLFHFFTLLGHFRVSPGLCLKTRVGAQPLIRKSFFILMQIKLIFTRKVVHLASSWKWGFLELGSGLLATCMYNASCHEQNDSGLAQTGRLKPHNNCIRKYILFQSTTRIRKSIGKREKTLF